MNNPFEFLGRLVMPNGTGRGRLENGQVEACVMHAAWIASELKKGNDWPSDPRDNPPCVSPVIRALLIRINDAGWWESDHERTRMLLPYVERILDTNRGLDLEIRRACKCADWACRVMAPLALDRAGLHDSASSLRKLDPIISGESAAAAAYAARDAAYAAAAAADYAAYAAAAYAAAADYAAADAADYAAYAADAADAAAATNAEMLFNLLDQLIGMEE